MACADGPHPHSTMTVLLLNCRRVPGAGALCHRYAGRKAPKGVVPRRREDSGALRPCRRRGHCVRVCPAGMQALRGPPSLNTRGLLLPVLCTGCRPSVPIAMPSLPCRAPAGLNVCALLCDQPADPKVVAKQANAFVLVTRKAKVYLAAETPPQSEQVAAAAFALSPLCAHAVMCAVCPRACSSWRRFEWHPMRTCETYERAARCDVWDAAYEGVFGA
jgi:hypothetical protein